MKPEEKLFLEKKTKNEKGGRTFVANIDFDIESPIVFRELFKELEEADESDIFIFNVNTYGGKTLTAIQLVDYIRSTKATTISRVYWAGSAGSFIALACKFVDVRPNGNMHIHNVKWETGFGDINKGKWQMDFSLKFAYRFYSDIYGGFLTEDEIRAVVYDGLEIWLTEEEIKERLKRRETQRGGSCGEKHNKR